MATIKGPGLYSPSLGDNLAEETAKDKQQREEAAETNRGIVEQGLSFNPMTQTVDTHAYVTARRKYQAAIAAGKLDSSVSDAIKQHRKMWSKTPTVSIKDKKVVLSGSDEFLASDEAKEIRETLKTYIGYDADSKEIAEKIASLNNYLEKTAKAEKDLDTHWAHFNKQIAEHGTNPERRALTLDDMRRIINSAYVGRQKNSRTSNEQIFIGYDYDDEGNLVPKYMKASEIFEMTKNSKDLVSQLGDTLASVTGIKAVFGDKELDPDTKMINDLQTKAMNGDAGALSVLLYLKGDSEEGYKNVDVAPLEEVANFFETKDLAFLETARTGIAGTISFLARTADTATKVLIRNPATAAIESMGGDASVFTDEWALGQVANYFTDSNKEIVSAVSPYLMEKSQLMPLSTALGKWTGTAEGMVTSAVVSNVLLQSVTSMLGNAASQIISRTNQAMAGSNLFTFVPTGNTITTIGHATPTTISRTVDAVSGLSTDVQNYAVMAQEFGSQGIYLPTIIATKFPKFSAMLADLNNTVSKAVSLGGSVYSDPKAVDALRDSNSQTFAYERMGTSQYGTVPGTTVPGGPLSDSTVLGAPQRGLGQALSVDDAGEIISFALSEPGVVGTQSTIEFAQAMGRLMKAGEITGTSALYAIDAYLAEHNGEWDENAEYEITEHMISNMTFVLTMYGARKLTGKVSDIIGKTRELERNTGVDVSIVGAEDFNKYNNGTVFTGSPSKADGQGAMPGGIYTGETPTNINTEAYSANGVVLPNVNYSNISSAEAGNLIMTQPVFTKEGTVSYRTIEVTNVYGDVFGIKVTTPEGSVSTTAIGDIEKATRAAQRMSIPKVNGSTLGYGYNNYGVAPFIFDAQSPLMKAATTTDATNLNLPTLAFDPTVQYMTVDDYINKVIVPTPTTSTEVSVAMQNANSPSLLAHLDMKRIKTRAGLIKELDRLTPEGVPKAGKEIVEFADQSIDGLKQFTKHFFNNEDVASLKITSDELDTYGRFGQLSTFNAIKTLSDILGMDAERFADIFRGFIKRKHLAATGSEPAHKYSLNDKVNMMLAEALNDKKFTNDLRLAIVTKLDAYGNTPFNVNKIKEANNPDTYKGIYENISADERAALLEKVESSNEVWGDSYAVPYKAQYFDVEKAYTKFQKDNLEPMPGTTVLGNALAVSTFQPAGDVNELNKQLRDGIINPSDLPDIMFQGFADNYGGSDTGARRVFNSEYMTVDNNGGYLSYEDPFADAIVYYGDDKAQKAIAPYLEDDGFGNMALEAYTLPNNIAKQIFMDNVLPSMNGNYRTTKPIVLSRGMNTGGNRVAKASEGGLDWLTKTGDTFTDPGAAFVSLSTEHALTYTDPKYVDEPGERVLVRYHIPEGTGIFYFNDYEFGLADGGAFVMPPALDGIVLNSEITTDLRIDGKTGIPVRVVDVLVTSPKFDEYGYRAKLQKAMDDMVSSRGLPAPTSAGTFEDIAKVNLAAREGYKVIPVVTNDKTGKFIVIENGLPAEWFDSADEALAYRNEAPATRKIYEIDNELPHQETPPVTKTAVTKQPEQIPTADEGLSDFMQAAQNLHTVKLASSNDSQGKATLAGRVVTMMKKVDTYSQALSREAQARGFSLTDVQQNLIMLANGDISELPEGMDEFNRTYLQPFFKTLGEFLKEGQLGLEGHYFPIVMKQYATYTMQDVENFYSDNTEKPMNADDIFNDIGDTGNLIKREYTSVEDGEGYNFNNLASPEESIFVYAFRSVTQGDDLTMAVNNELARAYRDPQRTKITRAQAEKYMVKRRELAAKARLAGKDTEETIVKLSERVIGGKKEFSDKDLEKWAKTRDIAKNLDYVTNVIEEGHRSGGYIATVHSQVRPSKAGKLLTPRQEMHNIFVRGNVKVFRNKKYINRQVNSDLDTAVGQLVYGYGILGHNMAVHLSGAVETSGSYYQAVENYMSDLFPYIERVDLYARKYALESQKIFYDTSLTNDEKQAAIIKLSQETVRRAGVESFNRIMQATNTEGLDKLARNTINIVAADVLVGHSYKSRAAVRVIENLSYGVLWGNTRVALLNGLELARAPGYFGPKTVVKAINAMTDREALKNLISAVSDIDSAWVTDKDIKTIAGIKNKIVALGSQGYEKVGEILMKPLEISETGKNAFFLACAIIDAQEQYPDNPALQSLMAERTFTMTAIAGQPGQSPMIARSDLGRIATALNRFGIRQVTDTLQFAKDIGGGSNASGASNQLGTPPTAYWKNQREKDGWRGSSRYNQAKFFFQEFLYRFVGWLTVGARAGLSLIDTLGFDPLGLLSSYSRGIYDDEDTEEYEGMNFIDYLVDMLPASSITSIIPDLYFAARRRGIAGDSYMNWDLWNDQILQEGLVRRLPGGSAAMRFDDALGLIDAGWSFGASDYAQFSAPNSIEDIVKAFTLGKWSTGNAQDYGHYMFGSVDPLSELSDGDFVEFAMSIPISLLGDLAGVDLNGDGLTMQSFITARGDYKSAFNGGEGDDATLSAAILALRAERESIKSWYNQAMNAYSQNESREEKKLRVLDEFNKKVEDFTNKVKKIVDAYSDKNPDKLTRSQINNLVGLFDFDESQESSKDITSTDTMTDWDYQRNRYVQAGLPDYTEPARIKVKDGKEVSSLDPYQGSLVYQNAVAGYYGGSKEAAKAIKSALIRDKFGDVYKEYNNQIKELNNQIYAEGVSKARKNELYDQQEAIQEEYLKLLEQELAPIIREYGSASLASEESIRVLQDYMKNMIPYSSIKEYKLRYPSGNDIVFGQLKDWAQQRWGNTLPATDEEVTKAIKRLKKLSEQGKNAQAKSEARALLEKISRGLLGARTADLEEIIKFLK